MGIKSIVGGLLCNLQSAGGRRGATSVAFAALLGMTGCGAQPNEGDVDTGDTGKATQALETVAWKNWAVINPEFDYGFTLDSDPAVGGNLESANVYFIAARRASNQKYYLKGFDSYVWSTGSKLFDGQQFWSPPSVALLSPPPGTPSVNAPFIIAGKALDNRIYMQIGTTDNLRDFTAPNPTPAAAGWTQVSSTQYVGDNNGFPTVASNGSRVVLACRSGNSIVAHKRAIPFSGSSWSSTSKALPAGVSATGTPTVAYMGTPQNSFVIIVRASGGLYWVLHNGTNFVGNWTPVDYIPYTHQVSSDPALEWDPQHQWLTLYFRGGINWDGGQKIVQTTSSAPSTLGQNVYAYIDPAGPHTFDSAPRAVWGAGIEAGHRTAIVREGGHLLVNEDILSAQ